MNKKVYFSIIVLIIILSSCITNVEGTDYEVLIINAAEKPNPYVMMMLDAVFEKEGIGYKSIPLDETLRDSAITESEIYSYDALLIIADELSGEPQYSKALSGICRQFSSEDKYIGAVGRSSAILAEAEVIDDHIISCWPEQKKLIENAGGIYSKRHIEFSGNIVTGIGGSDKNIYDFTNVFISLIKNNEVDEEILQNDISIDLVLDTDSARFIVSHADHLRTGEIYIPQRAADGTGFSLMFVLHGTAGEGADLKRYGFNSLAEEYGFIIVYPDGYNGDWDVLPGKETSKDDLGYFGKLISELSSVYKIDPERVYFTGHSLGAYMCYRLAYDMPDSVSAIAPVSGSFYQPLDWENKELSVSLLHIHAVDDWNVPYYGLQRFSNPMAVPDLVSFWCDINNISGAEGLTVYRGVEYFSRRNTDSGHEVILITHPAGGHAWLPGASREIISFFYNHPERSNRVSFKKSGLDDYIEAGKDVKIETEIEDPAGVESFTFFVNGLTSENISCESCFSLDDIEKGNYIITGSAVLKSGVTLPFSNAVEFTVIDPDLAVRAAASASSVESDSLKPENVTDHIRTSRWASIQEDPSWLQVDLGAFCKITSVTICWETAYASSYDIQISTDAKSWKTVYSTDSGEGGIENIHFGPADGRYLRVLGRKRATKWGYSIWDLHVHGKTLDL